MDKNTITQELLQMQKTLQKIKKEYRYSQIGFDYEFERHINIAQTVINMEWDKLTNSSN